MSKWTFKDIPKINAGLVEWWRKRHETALPPKGKAIPNLDNQADYRNYYGTETVSCMDNNKIPRSLTIWAPRNYDSVERDWEHQLYEADRHN